MPSHIQRRLVSACPPDLVSDSSPVHVLLVRASPVKHKASYTPELHEAQIGSCLAVCVQKVLLEKIGPPGGKEWPELQFLIKLMGLSGLKPFGLASGHVPLLQLKLLFFLGKCAARAAPCKQVTSQQE